MISLATSRINTQVRRNIEKCLDDNRIGQGEFIEKFEHKVATYMHAKHAIAVCNGSMADMVAVAALKACNPGKTEVIVPALTFIAHTNSVLINGLTPIFVDIKGDFQIDESRIQALITGNTLAIFPVHLLGKACDINKIKELADRYNIGLVEDCCEAFGGEDYTGKKLGTFGDFGTFSFFPSHTITTGEGGMLITNDDKLAELARSIRNHGRTGDSVLGKFHFNHLGFNGKMSNLLAAIGCAVMDTPDQVIEKRKENVEYLKTRIPSTGMGMGNWSATSPHCYPMIASALNRDEILLKLQAKGVEARKLFSCLPTQEKAYEHLGYSKTDFYIARMVGDYGYFIPIHQDLTKEDLDYMVSCLQ
ncbi:MAG: DegT/DnrJ/EryC1/StrS family aminotransferase [Bacteroidetes bacterium]|nr:DegT/DnrJ/EryC1/StrS family aminotransferase [Bacteroidota bacterium]